MHEVFGGDYNAVPNTAARSRNSSSSEQAYVGKRSEIMSGVYGNETQRVSLGSVAFLVRHLRREEV